MSRHPKPGGGRPNPQSDRQTANSEKRNVTGNVQVSGEILVDAGPKESLSRDIAQKKQDAKDRQKWWLEIATFAIVTIYAGLTAFQAYETREAVAAAQKANAQALEAVRPWVGPSGPIVMTKITDGQVQQIEYTTKLKNFGGSPAFRVIPIVNFVIGDREIKGHDTYPHQCCNR
jgi:hypothetical protein